MGFKQLSKDVPSRIGLVYTVYCLDLAVDRAEAGLGSVR
jgi:hypothetical protein